MSDDDDGEVVVVPLVVVVGCLGNSVRWDAVGRGLVVVGWSTTMVGGGGAFEDMVKDCIERERVGEDKDCEISSCDK